MPIAVGSTPGPPDWFRASANEAELALQPTGGSTGSISKGLLIFGGAMLAAGSYLVATTPRGYLYTAIVQRPTGTLQARDPECLPYDPYAGTGAPEIRCSPVARDIGIGLIVAGAGGIVGALVR